MMNVDLRDFLILLRYPVHRHSRVLLAGIQNPINSEC